MCPFILINLAELGVEEIGFIKGKAWRPWGPWRPLTCNNEKEGKNRPTRAKIWLVHKCFYCSSQSRPWTLGDHQWEKLPIERGSRKFVFHGGEILLDARVTAWKARKVKEMTASILEDLRLNYDSHICSVWKTQLSPGEILGTVWEVLQTDKSSVRQPAKYEMHI